MFSRLSWSRSANRRKEWQKDIPAVYEILRKGSEKAEKVAAETLKDVKAAMRINYFDDEELIKMQSAKYHGRIKIRQKIDRLVSGRADRSCTVFVICLVSDRRACTSG